MPSVSLIDDVFRNKSVELTVTTYVSLVFWLLFATAMYFSERDDRDDHGTDESKR